MINELRADMPHALCVYVCVCVFFLFLFFWRVDKSGFGHWMSF